MQTSSDLKPLIFTDLDGTLLDHNHYGFNKAANAIERIKRAGIALIINSSKTFAEIVPVQQALGICQPLICENGAAVYWPDQHSGKLAWQCQSFAKPRTQLLSVLQQLRRQYGYQFTGFSDIDPAGIRALTGLKQHQAEQAGERMFTEPILWQDDEQQLQHFLQQLKHRDYSAQQGGRFLTVVAGQVNKADAMAWLCQRYANEAAELNRSLIKIALGDSPNDESMLNAADIAVVIKSPRSESVRLNRPDQIIRTQLYGPAGWQAAMDEILPQFEP